LKRLGRVHGIADRALSPSTFVDGSIEATILAKAWEGFKLVSVDVRRRLH